MKPVCLLCIILLLLIAFLPILYMFGISLIKDGKLSFGNYAQVLSDLRQWNLFRNSLLVSGFTVLFSILFGVPFAFLVSRTNLPLRRLFSVLCIVPLLIPPYINAISWIYLLGERGRINLFLMETLGRKEPLFTIYGIWGTIFVLTLSYFPLVVLLTSAGLRALNSSLEEAGIMYRSKWQSIKSVSLRLVLPSIFSGGLFVFILSLSNFGVPSLLRVNVYTVEIFTQFSAFHDFSQATATSVPLVILVLLAVLFQRTFEGKKGFATIGSSWVNPVTISPGKGRWLAFLYCAIIVFLSVLLPLGVLAREAESLRYYKEAFLVSRSEILHTFLFSSISATLIVILGGLLAYTIVRSVFGMTRSLDIFSVLPYAFVATVLGLGMIRLWNHPGVFKYIYNSMAIVILTYIARFSPFAIKSLSPSLKQIDYSLEESSALCGIGRIKSMARIVLPLSLRGIAATWVLVFILSSGELPATILVCPPGYMTVPIKIFNMIHFGRDETLSALCLILIVMISLPLLIYYLFSYRHSMLSPKRFPPP